MTRLALVSLLVGAMALPFGGNAHRRTEQGNRLYVDGLYDEALRAYTEAQVDAPEAPELYYDIGNVLYRQDDFVGATEAFERSLMAAPDRLAGDAAYNLGNARFADDDFEGAVEAFERALRSAPDDEDAKRNLELSLQALEQQQQQQQQQQQDEGDESEESEEQQQQQQQQEEQDAGEEQDESGSDSSEGEQGEEQSDSPTESQGEDDGQAGQEPGEPTPETGQMTPEQAEKLLESLRESEKANLRDQALKQVPTRARGAEQDW